MTIVTTHVPGTTPEPVVARVARLWDELHSPVVGRRIAGTVPVSVVAGLVSLAASAWFVPSGLSLAYGDALSHLTIARRLFDTMTDPGLGQLGTVWLPIPHVLLMPFVLWLWAWQTGWGAALLGALCLAATAAGCYRAAARWGLGLTARLVVVSLIVFNPSMLYLHATALTEPVLIAGISGTLAGLSNWATKSRRLSPGELAVFAGIPAAVATMSRYEGWALVLAGSLFVGIVSWLRDRRLAAVATYVFGFAIVPFVTMLWWLAYNWVTFHDPLAFIFGQYSASALQADLVAQGLTTKGDLAGSIATMNLAVAGTAGTGTLALAGLALVVLAFTERSVNRWLFLAMTTITYVFMAFSLWAGQAVIFNPASSDTSIWNNRYGMASALPLALLVGIGVDVVSSRLKRTRPRLANLRRALLGALVAVAIIGQTVWQLEDVTSRSFVLSEAQTQYTLKAGARSAAEWLGSHYDGGQILLDEAVAGNNILPIAGIPLREYYLRSTDTLFDDAIADPATHARWLWASDDASDAVTNSLAASPSLAAGYQVAFSDDTVKIYVRTGG
ncbi:MAG: hypothetical protein QM779_11005 [Propionicimonas sp.]|uniref:hypothetical protein n=1 Tax=Propionicimonas sp. TaxID=1955623 RepID=UPI003D1160A9